MKPEFKQKAVEEFAKSIRNKYGKKIKEIILYGSMARKEDNDYSDIDILVLSYKKYRFLQRELSFLAFDIGLKYGVEISVQNYVSSHYKKYSNYLFSMSLKIIRNEEGGLFSSMSFHCNLSNFLFITI